MTVNYSIFKKLEDKEEIKMIYRDNDIRYLEIFVKEQDKEIERLNNIIEQQNTRNSRQRVANKDLLDRFNSLMEAHKICDEENDRLNNIINELEKDFERKIQSCTIEAETTTNDFYCRLHIATLKKWLNKIQELKGSESNDKQK